MELLIHFIARFRHISINDLEEILTWLDERELLSEEGKELKEEIFQIPNQY